MHCVYTVPAITSQCLSVRSMTWIASASRCVAAVWLITVFVGSEEIATWCISLSYIIFSQLPLTPLRSPCGGAAMGITLQLLTAGLLHTNQVSITQFILVLIYSLWWYDPLIYAASYVDRAVKAFQQILYNDSNFSRTSDVHFRIGMVHKNSGNYENAAKVSPIVPLLPV